MLRRIAGYVPHRLLRQTTILSEEPPVYLLRDFLSPCECEKLKKAGIAKKLERSKVAVAQSDWKPPSLYWGEEDHSLDQARTSSSANIDAVEHKWLMEKASQIVNVPTANFEPPQVCRYLPGERYLAHHDGFEAEHESLKTGGQRVATLIAYLNDCDHGGHTSFPNLDLSVAPLAGSAVLFFPASYPLGKLDERLLHAAEPVEVGDGGDGSCVEKWVCQIWVRQRNYFT